jgi:hypothetical protein
MTTMCFCSAFAAPQIVAQQAYMKNNASPSKLHSMWISLLLSGNPNMSSIGLLWYLVAFLVDPQVSPILRPSMSLKQAVNQLAITAGSLTDTTYAN